MAGEAQKRRLPYSRVNVFSIGSSMLTAMAGLAPKSGIPWISTTGLFIATIANIRIERAINRILSWLVGIREWR